MNRVASDGQSEFGYQHSAQNGSQFLRYGYRNLKSSVKWFQPTDDLSVIFSSYWKLKHFAIAQ